MIRLTTEPADSSNIIADHRITKLAFFNRFTTAELVAIDLGSVGNTEQAAMVRTFMLKANAASFIDLSRLDTSTGVHGLVSLGLLESGRENQILNYEISDEERPS